MSQIERGLGHLDRIASALERIATAAEAHPEIAFGLQLAKANETPSHDSALNNFPEAHDVSIDEAVQRG